MLIRLAAMLVLDKSGCNKHNITERKLFVLHVVYIRSCYLTSVHNFTRLNNNNTCSKTATKNEQLSNIEFVIRRFRLALELLAQPLQLRLLALLAPFDFGLALLPLGRYHLGCGLREHVW